MLSINIFVISIGLMLVKLIAAELTEITFHIQFKKSPDAVSLTCDHNDLNNLKTYTVIQGGEIKITTKYNYFINHLLCRDHTDGENIFAYNNNHSYKNVTTFRVEKKMGTLWNCTILTHRSITAVLPVVQYENNNYTAAYCFMKIHVRQANPTEITFNIHSQKSQDAVWLTCDHNDLKNLKTYTVIEGGEIKINTKFNYFINHLICRDYIGENIFAYYDNHDYKNVTTYKVEKRMGTLWNCTILTQRGFSKVLPVVQYENNEYTAAHCFMKIHVRQTKPPQTILVNNIVLPAVRTNLSEKLTDFTAEYQFEDGEIVDVTCANLLQEEPLLTMEYKIAGAMINKFSRNYIQSAKAIRIVTKLHSGHNNSYMICEAKEPTDYTKVMVRFVMLNKLNFNENI